MASLLEDVKEFLISKNNWSPVQDEKEKPTQCLSYRDQIGYTKIKL